MCWCRPEMRTPYCGRMGCHPPAPAVALKFLRRDTDFRRFRLVREVDPSGVSGTGVVANGVEFPTGVCVLEWIRDPQSLGIYRSADHLLFVHGHEGRTTMEMID